MSVALLRKLGHSKAHCEALVEQMEYEVCVTDGTEWPDDVDLVIRWGCTANVPWQADLYRPKIINKARAIHLVNDKVGFRRLVQEQVEGVVPKTWFYWNDADIPYPCIIRPDNHTQGNDLYHCQDENDACDALEFIDSDNYYISEYIPKVAEYRVFVVQGRVACVAQKIPEDPSAIAWNHAQGAKFENVRWGSWNLEVCRKAIVAFNLTGLDFGAVDVIVGDTAYVLEINTAPSLESEYRASCLAKCLDYMIENGKENIPINNLWHTWRAYIHPAIWKEPEA